MIGLALLWSRPAAGADPLDVRVVGDGVTLDCTLVAAHYGGTGLTVQCSNVDLVFTDGFER